MSPGRSGRARKYQPDHQAAEVLAFAELDRAAVDRGHIAHDGEPEAEVCAVWIEDDGLGIRQEQRAVLFSRGARLDTEKPGTGLGLAIVRDVAAIYGGSVDLGESEDLGGLMVRLILPRAA